MYTKSYGRLVKVTRDAKQPLSAYSIRDDVSDKQWDQFVYEHPHGNIFQTRDMFNVYKQTKNYGPVGICLWNKETNAVAGVLSSVIIREYGGMLGKITSRSVVQGGPLIATDEDMLAALSKILEAYGRSVENKALFTQIRNLFDVGAQFGRIGGYRREDHLNFLIDLRPDEKELWGRIHKDRRKNINRSINRGTVIEEVRDRALIEPFYGLLQETYRNVKVPLADISLFHSAYGLLVPKKMAAFFLIKHDGKYIGARVVLTYKDVVYDWYAGAANGSLSLYPNEHLVWHILKWGKENGYKTFDFGGAGKPDVPYGPREFKRRFGGDLVNYGWYERIHAPITTWAVMGSFKAYQRIKGLTGG